MNGAEAWAARVGVEHLQAPFGLDHHPNMQAKRTAKHGSNGSGLRRAFVHPLAEVVIRRCVLPHLVLPYPAKAGQQGESEHLVADMDAQPPAIERKGAPRTFSVGRGKEFVQGHRNMMPGAILVVRTSRLKIVFSRSKNPQVKRAALFEYSRLSTVM